MFGDCQARGGPASFSPSFLVRFQRSIVMRLKSRGERWAEGDIFGGGEVVIGDSS